MAEQDKRVARRQRMERAIVRAVAKALIDAGYEISVYDGEEYPVKRSRDLRAIMRAVMTTDCDEFVVREPGKHERAGWCQFVYGNDGWDVLADYTTNFETIFAPVMALSDKFQSR